jgi:O-antigen ligase
MINSFKKNSFIEKSIFFLIFLFICSLVSGPFLPDLFISLIAFFFLYYFIKDFRLFIKNKIIKLFFIFYLYIVFTSFFSEVPIESLKTSIVYIRFLIFVIAINILFNNIKFQYIFFYGFIFLYTSLFLDSIYQIYFGYNIFELIKDTDRVSSFFGKELILGSFVSKTIPIVLYLLFSLKITKNFFIYLYIVFISFFLVLVSSERSSLFVYLIIIIFSLFFLKKREILFTFFICFSSIFLSFLFYPKTFDRLYSHTYNQISNANKFFLFSYRHQLHYLSAIKMFQDHIFFGTGVKSFRYLCSDEKYSLVEEIYKDNVTYAKDNGQIIYLKDQKTDQTIYLIINDIMKADIAFQNILFQKFNSNYYYYLSSLDKNLVDDVVYRHSLQGAFKIYVNDGQQIEKGQPIYSWYEYKNGCNTHPHNFYIQFLAELGAIGFLFLFLFYYYVSSKLYKYFLILKKNIEPKFILYAGYVAILFPLIPSGNFFNNYLSLLLMLPLCFFKLCPKK